MGLVNALLGVDVELFSTEFFSALLAIIIIDLVLAGDNAIVIALAARSLPPDQRGKPCFGGHSAQSRCALQ